MTNVTRQINCKTTIRALAAVFLILLGVTWQAPLSAAQSRENGVVKAIRAVSPAVVNISSEYDIHKNSNPFSGYGMDPMLEKFFRDFFSPELERREKRTSLGSGVIIDGEHGLVLTNAHVIEKASTIRVALLDKREFEASIVGMDPDSDLAVLKIQSDQPLPAIVMGDSDDIMIGESVIAIGNPFGFSHTVTTGVVSAVNRSIKTGDRVYHEFIQTDASINPGNSGGPLININAELIGINTAIYAEAQGIGFAIPINRARRIISDLINYGTVVDAWIGVTAQPLDVNLADYLGIDGHHGVMVSSIEPDSPAAKAGIHEGDIILSVNGVRISSIADYEMKIKQISVGEAIALEINRKGKRLTFSPTAVVFPIEQALPLAQRLLGITVTDLNAENRSRYAVHARSGVLIERMRRGSYLDRIGVRPGDIIRQIGEVRVDALADFKSAIVKYRSKSAMILMIQREGQLYYVNAIIKDGNR